MPKAPLSAKDSALEDMMCQTFMAGCNNQYPQSRSDVEWGIRALMKMFSCERLPVARELEYEDDGRPKQLRATTE